MSRKRKGVVHKFCGCGREIGGKNKLSKDKCGKCARNEFLQRVKMTPMEYEQNWDRIDRMVKEMEKSARIE